MFIEASLRNGVGWFAIACPMNSTGRAGLAFRCMFTMISFFHLWGLVRVLPFLFPFLSSFLALAVALTRRESRAFGRESRRDDAHRNSAWHRTAMTPGGASAVAATTR